MFSTENELIDRLQNEVLSLNSSLFQTQTHLSQTQTHLSETQAKLSGYDQELFQKDGHIAHLEEQLTWLKRQLFGQRSERVVADLDQKQLGLPGFENLQTVIEEEKKKVASHSRRKPNRNGQDKITLHPDLPVKTIILDLPEEEKTCLETGEPLVKIGEEVTHKLAHQPGSYYIKEIIRPKYAHPKREELGILTAELPETLLPRCQADESLLAEILTQKFSDHLPLYRIAQIMERHGVTISRKLLSQWVIRTGLAFKPLYEAMRRHILDSGNIFIDEIPVKLWEKVKCKQAYMWVVVGGKGSDPPYRVYDFRENRKHENVTEILEGYHGVLHSDKYGAYEKLGRREEIIWCPCWAHIRRKFFEAESDLPFRAWILRKIKYLFMLERVAWKRSPEERLQIRQEKEVVIVDEIIKAVKYKLVGDKVLPKSKLKGALGYCCSLIPNLKNYTKHPFARLDNNVAERAVRPLAIGRKNWLFFGSPAGGEAGAIIYSLVQTCRGLGVNPREYLEDVSRRLMGHKACEIDELLPDRWAITRQQK